MSIEDILKFTVHFYSADGISSPVADYLADLARKDRDAVKKCLKHIENLPVLVHNKNNKLKKFSHPKLSFSELKIKGKNKTEFRFFYMVEKDRIVVFHAFSKNTAKTEKKDAKRGGNNLEDYLDRRITVTPFVK